MKTKKWLILWSALIILLLIVAGTAYYLLSVQKILAPVEDRYADKKPNFSFSNTVTYVPADNLKVFTIDATTDAPHKGECIYVFTNAGKRIEATNNVANDYHCYISKPFTFFGTDGLWNVFILLKSSSGEFATKRLENVEINSNYKPKELTFTSVDTSYKKDANGNGINYFKAQMSGKATGNCYFLFNPETGKTIGDFSVVSKYIPVKDSDTCSFEVSSTEFKAKGWWSYSVSFQEPYNRFHFQDYESREFIYY